MFEVAAPSFVEVQGRRLAYDEVSPPDPLGTVLLLTGLASKRLGWYRQLPVFGQTYRTIALDHRDVGDSDPADGPYTTGDQADDAAAVLRALGIEGAHVVGISMGGYIAQELAARHPALVRKLVLTGTSAGGPSHVPPAPEIAALLTQSREGMEIGELARRTYAVIMAPGYLDAHPDDAEHIMETARYRPQTLEAYLRQLQACLGHNMTDPDRLSQLRVPALVIHGDMDPLVPTANGLYLAAHLPDARLLLYGGVGHMAIVERAEEYNRDVLAFLAA
jgi:pimeloyl-ACP methyl ester carboxylesterase